MPPWVFTGRNMPHDMTPIMRGGASAFNPHDHTTWPSGTLLAIDSNVGYFPNPPAVRNVTRFYEMDGFSDPYEIRTVQGNFAMADQSTWPRGDFGTNYTYRIRGIEFTGNITFLRTDSPGLDHTLYDGADFFLPWQQSTTGVDLYVDASLSLNAGEPAEIWLLVEIIDGQNPDPSAPADLVFIYHSIWTPVLI